MVSLNSSADSPSSPPSCCLPAGLSCPALPSWRLTERVACLESWPTRQAVSSSPNPLCSFDWILSLPWTSVPLRIEGRVSWVW